MQLHIVVMQQPPKELVGGGSESPLMEVSEGHNVAFRRRWRILIAGQPPLLGGGPRTKKATMIKALQALEGDIGSAPWLHGTIGRGVDASLMAAAMRVQEAQAIGSGSCRCKGEMAKYGTLGVNPLVL